MVKENDPRARVLSLLALHIGVEPEDISEEDFIEEDLHMSPADLSDFTQTLNDNYNTQKLDLTSIETVGDLVDALFLHSDI